MAGGGGVTHRVLLPFLALFLCALPDAGMARELAVSQAR